MSAAQAIGRRGFGGLVLCAAFFGPSALRAATPTPIPPTKNLRFSIARNGSTIGTHELTFEPSGDDLLVRIEVHMRVGLGPFTFFRYHHQGEERWQGGKFVSLHTVTDHNGEALTVSAQRDGEHIRVQATGIADQSLQGDVLPLTHWNVACMHTRLFNPETGILLDEVSKSKGQDMVKLSNGDPVEATHYALAGKAPIDDWYDEKQVWTALRASVRDGSVLHYTRDV